MSDSLFGAHKKGAVRRSAAIETAQMIEVACSHWRNIRDKLETHGGWSDGKMPLKVSQYWRKTSTHSKEATSLGAMPSASVRWNARML